MGKGVDYLAVVKEESKNLQVIHSAFPEDR